MEKIGRIRALASIVPKEYEVIELEGRLFAGIDAFCFPENQHDLRCLECLLIPEEWEWTERFVIRDAEYGEPAPIGAKYHAIYGEEARQKIEEICSRHETGCLTLFDKEWPYAIPINHAYRDGRLYMHCGKKGKKLGLIRQNPKAAYMLYGEAEEVPKGVRSCHLPYESIIFYGTVRICEDAEEKELAIQEITDQYGTPYEHGFADMIEILVLDIHHATARTGRFKPHSKRDLYYFVPERKDTTIG
ncbi:MAG: hypothetical protein HFI40_02480 [Lachnospiraceae bacterium]|jgi:nitroimidazol reductase NimA-like FMN-containing flavoprotein (pyridoxamine 5'-phosphate oxidase superfamily)|nr:hypothetical protein [Lachnospiraceae bacterium]MCX4317241.1 pyridoxamine 5'-phosphate oxidase family protein [Lachnospiraceae bacterium]